MRKVSILVALFLIGILCLTGVQAQVGLRVAPPQVYVRDVTLGEKLEVATLVIVNLGGGTQTYAISIDWPTSYREGYNPFPKEGYDQGWVTFDKDRITLGPGESGEVKVFLEIPDEKKYHAQNWETWVNIEGYGAVAVAAAVRMLISTAGEPPSTLDRMIMFIQEEAITIASIGAIIVCIIAGVYVFSKKFEIKIRRK